MKKIYEVPEVEIEKFRIEDVITNSSPDPDELPKDQLG
jgi:hypothetical protein